MASTLKLFTNQGVIPMERHKDESKLPTVTLTNKVTLANGQQEKRTLEITMATDDDVETLIRCVIDFQSGMGDDSLGLSNVKKFSEFRKCVNFIVRDKYDNCRRGRPGNDEATFRQVCSDLIAQFCPSSSYADQKRYMEQWRKPLRMTVMECCNRLESVNLITDRLPGSAGVTCFSTNADHPQLKVCFFNMMRHEWKLDFAKSAHNINANTYTLNDLRDYMITQQSIDDNRFGINRNRGNFPIQQSRTPQRYNSPGYRYNNNYSFSGSRYNNNHAPYPQNQRPQPSPGGFRTPNNRGSVNRANPRSSRSTPRAPFNRGRFPAPPSNPRAASRTSNIRSPPALNRQPGRAFSNNYNDNRGRRDNFFGSSQSGSNFGGQTQFDARRSEPSDQYFNGEEINYGYDNNYGGEE